MTTAPSSNGAVPANVHDAARYYIDHGQAPIPLPFRSKKPALDDWPGLRLTADTLDDYFPPGRQLNVGLICGRLSQDADGGEVVVDLDCPEALRAADRLLPRTGRVSGRPGNPRSHRHYLTDDPPAKAHDKYKDPVRAKTDKDGDEDRACLVELLSNGRK